MKIFLSLPLLVLLGVRFSDKKFQSDLCQICPMLPDSIPILSRWTKFQFHIFDRPAHWILFIPFLTRWTFLLGHKTSFHILPYPDKNLEFWPILARLCKKSPPGHFSKSLCLNLNFFLRLLPLVQLGIRFLSQKFQPDLCEVCTIQPDFARFHPDGQFLSKIYERPFNWIHFIPFLTRWTLWVSHKTSFHILP